MYGRNNQCMSFAMVVLMGVFAPSLFGAVVSLPLPPQGDSYYLKGWKHDIVEVIPANLGHDRLDFVAKTYILTSQTMFIEGRAIDVNDPDGTFLWQYGTGLTSKWTQDRQDVTSFGSGYGSMRLTPQVVEDVEPLKRQ